jgi:hypothetical protein
MTQNALLLRFTLGTRVLLSVGFFAPGMTKLFGQRFVTVVTDDPVGRFFEALYQAGPYWRLLGAAQVLAAVLVLIRRTTAAGALLFFGIMLNVAFITSSLPFGNTAIVAGLMLLASAWLVLWEFPRWAPLIGGAAQPFEEPRIGRVERAGWLVCTAAGWWWGCILRGLIGEGSVLIAMCASLLVGGGGGALLLAGWARAWQRARLGR